MRRHHEHYHSRGGGHLYQGRFKSFPVAEDDYFLALCRYVEANPLRAELVEGAEQWQWSALWRRAQKGLQLELPLTTWPVERPRNWVAWVNRGLNEEQLDAIRICVERGRPFGSEDWLQQTRSSGLALSSPFAAPADPENFLKISDAPFSFLDVFLRKKHQYAGTGTACLRTHRRQAGRPVRIAAATGANGNPGYYSSGHPRSCRRRSVRRPW